MVAAERASGAEPLWDPQKVQLRKLLRGASPLEILAEMAREFVWAAKVAARGGDRARAKELRKIAVVLEWISGDVPSSARRGLGR